MVNATIFLSFCFLDFTMFVKNNSTVIFFIGYGIIIFSVQCLLHRTKLFC